MKSESKSKSKSKPKPNSKKSLKPTKAKKVNVAKSKAGTATAIAIAVAIANKNSKKKKNKNNNTKNYTKNNTKKKNNNNKKGQTSAPPPPPEEEEPKLLSGDSISDARVRMDARPDVSSIVVDEQTGIERIQQGKYVMDVVTRKAVQLSSLGPMYRLAQMFPGVQPELRDLYRFDWSKAEVGDMIEQLRDACSVKESDGIKDDDGNLVVGIPPHPVVTNAGLDFVLANRDYLGPRMKKTLGRLKLQAQSQGDVKAASEYRQLWKHYMTIDDSLSAPFKQMIMDAEGRVGPNFGNLDLRSFCGTEVYERTASYLVLKGMVAHWEKKVRDAEYVERTPETRSNFIDVLMVGDPKRYLPDPPIIFRYDEVVRITLMAQNMTAQFVNTPELFDDLPVEVRFFEAATFIKGGTTLRQFMIEDFCPAEGITPEGLREGLRRLEVQLSNMQIDPYGDLKNVMSRLVDTMAVGTDDARDPYVSYLYSTGKDGPGYFQTYTFNHDRQSLVRFLDNAKEIQQGSIGPTSNLIDQLSNEANNLFGFGPKPEEMKKQIKNEVYKVPDKRSCGRPHNTGWLDLLGDEEVNGGSSTKTSDDPEDEVYESDNWREVISQRQKISR
mmetsp:Transcript_21009/g.31561  ORF Transcript_21009/g.31561 Transcript_21009/m.31561 type:complete len:610 (-) Transcript_21009:62-1891(-)